MKTLVIDNSVAGGTLSYVRHVEAIHPDIGLTLISKASLPAIFLVPMNENESWVTTQKKHISLVVRAYLILSYNQRESSILGDATRGTQGAGILDFVNDFLTVFRSHRLSVGGVNYLDKPIEIRNITYLMDHMGENAHILIAEVTLDCSRLFTQQMLPGDV